MQTLVVAWLLQGIALLSAPGRRAAFALSIILAGLGIVWSHAGHLGPFEPHLLGALMGASFAALGILDKVRGAPTLILLPAGALLGVTALPRWRSSSASRLRWRIAAGASSPSARARPMRRLSRRGWPVASGWSGSTAQPSGCRLSFLPTEICRSQVRAASNAAHAASKASMSNPG